MEEQGGRGRENAGRQTSESTGQVGLRERPQGLARDAELRQYQPQKAGIPQPPGGDGQVAGRAIAGTVNAENVSVKGLVALARSREASLQGATGALVTAGDAAITGASGMVISGGDTKVTAAGVPFVRSGGETSLEKSGVLLSVSREIDVEDHGYVGIALAGKVKVEEGGRVFVTALPAILFGVLLGGTFALVTALTRGWRPDVDAWRKGLRRGSRQAQKAVRTQARRAGINDLDVASVIGRGRIRQLRRLRKELQSRFS